MKNDQLPNSLTEAASGLLGVLVALTVTGILAGWRFAAPRLARLGARLSLKYSPAAKAAVSGAADLVPLALRPLPTPVGRDFSAYEPSIPRCVQFPQVGHLTLWAFRTIGIVQRQLVISDEALARRVGANRIPMPEMKWPKATALDLIEEQAIVEAEMFLQDKLGRRAVGTRVSDLTMLPSVAAAKAEVSAKAKTPGAKPYGHVPGPVNVLQRTVGVLRFAGPAERTLGGKTSMQYAVDVEQPGIGVQRLWGVDLERALADAGAEVGHKVQLDYTGTSPITLPEGGHLTKKHFNAKVL